MAKSDLVQVRILTGTPVDGVQYAGNRVVSFKPELAKQLKAAGAVDDSKEAVAYCLEELKVEPVVHGAEEEPA